MKPLKKPQPKVPKHQKKILSPAKKFKLRLRKAKLQKQLDAKDNYFEHDTRGDVEVVKKTNKQNKKERRAQMYIEAYLKQQRELNGGNELVDQSKQTDATSNHGSKTDKLMRSTIFASKNACTALAPKNQTIARILPKVPVKLPSPTPKPTCCCHCSCSLAKNPTNGTLDVNYNLSGSKTTTTKITTQTTLKETNNSSEAVLVNYGNYGVCLDPQAFFNQPTNQSMGYHPRVQFVPVFDGNGYQEGVDVQRLIIFEILFRLIITVFLSNILIE